MTREQRGRPLRRGLAAAAAVVILVAAAAGVTARLTDDGPDRLTAEYVQALRVLGGKSLAAAELHDRRGRPVGEAFVYEGSPSWLFVAVAGGPRDDRYELELVLADGRVVRRPAPWVRLGEGSWGRTIEQGAEAVRSLRVVGSSGWSCRADFETS